MKYSQNLGSSFAPEDTNCNLQPSITFPMTEGAPLLVHVQKVIRE